MKSVRVAIAAGRESRGLFEDAAECGRVGIPDTAPDLIDWVASRFEQPHGVLDAGVLEVGLRPVSRGRREPTRQGALAQPKGRREIGDPQRLVQEQVDVLLDLVHQHVIMRPFRPNTT